MVSGAAMAAFIRQLPTLVTQLGQLPCDLVQSCVQDDILTSWRHVNWCRVWWCLRVGGSASVAEFGRSGELEQPGSLSSFVTTKHALPLNTTAHRQ